jgi:hypothetical protein
MPGKLPVFNTTSQTIPPYACMMLRRAAAFSTTKAATNTDAKSNFLNQHLSGGVVVWDVTICNSEGEGRQDPAEFIFNGPVPIPPLDYGEGWQDWPCRVLHNCSEDRLANMTACGPVADRWYVSSSGSAFVCKSHDVSLPVEAQNFRTIWVDRGKGDTITARGRFSVAGTSVATDAMLTITEPAPSIYLAGFEVEDGGEWVTARRSGLYLVSFSGLLTSSSATLGQTLSLRLYTKRDSDDGPVEATTPYVVSRAMDIVSSTRLAGNVAFSGFETLEIGDAVGLKNVGEVATVTGGVLTLARIGDSIEEEDGDEDSY